jgi:type IV pilus assembly protein PilC
MARDDETLLTFQYEAITPSGNRIKGSRARMQAYNHEMVRRELLDQGFIPISINQVTTTGLRRSIGNSSPKMKTSELAGFTRQLHELLRSGVPAPRAIASLAEEAPSPKLQEMCMELAGRVSSGSTLAEAFATYPRAFSSVYCAYLASGEKTGSIVEATARLAMMLERQAKIRSKVVSVITYPALVGGVILVLVAGILLFLVPQFEGIYKSFGAELPRPTQVLVAFSRKVPMLLALLAGSTFLTVSQTKRYIKKNPAFGVKLDKVRFKLPVAGKMFHRVALYRWCTTLSGSLEAGLPQTQALEIAASSSGSPWIRAVTPSMVESVSAGRPMSGLLSEHGWLFPGQVRTMISTGETSGETPRLLESASESLNNEIDAMIATMGAKIEVFLLLFLGGTVGGLLIILYLPIISLAATFGDTM